RYPPHAHPDAPQARRNFLFGPARRGGRLTIERGATASSPDPLRGNPMLRTRVLRPRWLTVAVSLWAVVWLALPVPGEGAPLPPSRTSPADQTRPSDVELSIVREALVHQGLTPADADLVLARLTPAERA